ncbi:MAG: hypothetical protein H6R15_2937 [Proteobacteria bacterium]|nr:hypothetical protein [Pseudomonadota bacterium]
MSTTSLKISDELKQRAIHAAQQQGLSPHAFMVQAIEQAARAAELRASFVDDALAAREAMRQSGTGYEADDVRAYIKARIAGQTPKRPKAKSWRG